MDEGEVVKIGMEIALRPVTDITENALGVLGGDWLSEIRNRNRAKLKEKTAKLLRNRDVKPDEVPSPAVVIPLLAGAQDASADELQEIWARLLAAVLDSKRSGGFRKEFLEIARKMEPLDAAILPMLNTEEKMEPTRAVEIAKRLGIHVDQVLNSFAFLKEVGLVDEVANISSPQFFPRHTPLGRQFLVAISD